MGQSRELPQLQDSQPVLNVQPVNSKAEGYEAFAKTLGDIADKSATKAKEMGEEQSNASFLQSQAQATTIKTDAQIAMIKHPDMANKIAEQSASTLEQLNQSAFVNSKDRQKLQYLASNDFNELRLKAATTSFQQSQNDLSIAYWHQYPVTNKNIQDALMKGDFKTAQTLEESLDKASMDAAHIGAITAAQYASVRKTNYELYSRTQSLLDMAKNPNGHSAADYHAANLSPFDNTNFNNTGFPVDGNTKWFSDHYNDDRTMAGQYASLYSGGNINWGVVASGTENQFNDFKMQLMGTQKVQGAIHSGMPFSQIEDRMKHLEGKPKLDSMETGELNYWKGFKNNIQSGDGYLRMMAQTSMGGQYTQEFNHKQVAIQNSGVYSPEGKSQALKENYNNYIGQMVGLGQAQHIDPSYIRPIPDQTVSVVKNAFAKDAPVAPALERIAYLNPEYRPYLANAMPKPNQGMAVWVAGTTMGRADASFQADLIQANKDNISPIDQQKGDSKEKTPSSLITSSKESVATKPDNIWNDILNENDSMKDLYSYLGKMPGGKTAQDGFRQMAVNYVYDQAQRSGDFDLQNKSTYVSNFSSNTLKGFNLYRTDKAFMNLNDISVTRPQDADFLVNYALSHAYKAIHEGKSEVEFQRSLDLNPLMVVSTPDKRLVVVDRYGRAASTPNGHEAFDQPYTSHMLSAAQAHARDISDYLVNYGGSEDYQKDANFPVTPQDVMMHASAVRQRAAVARRNEEALRKARAGKGE